MSTVNSLPWKDGYYKMTDNNNCVFLVNGETVNDENLTGETDAFSSEEDASGKKPSFGTWKFGDFGEANSEVRKATGKQNYNVDLSLWKNLWLVKGVVSDDGLKVTVMGMGGKLMSFEHMSDKEYQDFKDSADPADAPSSHYPIQPEVKGHLLWISGAPGLGKSTTGLYLSRHAGYVYYEADAFGGHANPYIPPDVEEPSLATMNQKPLKDVPKERINAIKKGGPEFMKLVKGEDCDIEKVKDYYTALCKDITSEKKRLGGNWVVAQAVPSKILRDHIRNELGKDLTFVVLHMTKDDQKKRIHARHGDTASAINDWLTKMYDLFEPAQKDEVNTIGVDVTNDMSRDDVMNLILDKTEN